MDLSAKSKAAAPIPILVSAPPHLIAGQSSTINKLSSELGSPTQHPPVHSMVHKQMRNVTSSIKVNQKPMPIGTMVPRTMIQSNQPKTLPIAPATGTKGGHVQMRMIPIVQKGSAPIPIKPDMKGGELLGGLSPKQVKVSGMAMKHSLTQSNTSLVKGEPPTKKMRKSGGQIAKVETSVPLSLPGQAILTLSTQIMGNNAGQVPVSVTTSQFLQQQALQTLFFQQAVSSSGLNLAQAMQLPSSSAESAVTSQGLKGPILSTKPILMQTSMSPKIVVHAPPQQSHSLGVESTATVSNSLPLVSSSQMSVTPQAVLQQSRLLQVSSTPGNQKFILMPSIGSQPLHLIGTGVTTCLPQTSLAVNSAGIPATTAVIATTRTKGIPNSTAATTASQITIPQKGLRPGMMPSVLTIPQGIVTSDGKTKQVPVQFKNKLPANVKARYVPHAKISPQAGNAGAKPVTGRIFTFGQVGAITNSTTAQTKVSPSKGSLLNSAIPVTQLLASVPTTAVTSAISSISSNDKMIQNTPQGMLPQQNILVHAGNLTRQFMTGTPVIFNIPGSGKQQTAILVPQHTAPNQQQLSAKTMQKVIAPIKSPVKTMELATSRVESKTSKSAAMSQAAMSASTAIVQAAAASDHGAKPTVIKVASRPNSHGIIKVKMPPSTTMAGPASTTLSSVAVGTYSIVPQNTAKAQMTASNAQVIISSAPIMTTAVIQNGRLLQLMPAQPGPVSAAIQPQDSQPSSRSSTPQSYNPPIKFADVVDEPEKEPVSTIELAIKMKAPYPQAPISKHPRKEVKIENENEVKPSQEEKTDVEKKEEEQPEKVEKTEDEVEFTWDEYLEITGTLPAAHTSFKHVELSLMNPVKTGMKLEAPNHPSTLNPYRTYWVATVIQTCGSLMLLRYDGYGLDRSADFWSDIKGGDLHPVGWCARNGQMLQPPDAILNKPINWQEFLISNLTGTKTIPEYCLQKSTGILPFEKLTKGHHLDVIDEDVPTQAWIACILENHGGRLKLRYGGAKESQDFYLFYLSYRLHPAGWAKEHRVIIKPPKFIQQQSPQASETYWRSIYFGTVSASAVDSALPSDFFKVRKELFKIKVNRFQEGMKLEAINPLAPHKICPGTISKIFNIHFFQVMIDNLDRIDKERISFVCHMESGSIFPVNWCKDHGFNISPPKGYQHAKFEWSKYLKMTNSKPAPAEHFRCVTDRRFQNGMKLEAVNPFNPQQICVATITKIAGRHMWLHFDGSKHPNHIIDAESHDIFPVGWCESNCFPLKSPKRLMARKKKIAIVWPEKQTLGSVKPGKDLYQMVREANQEDTEEGWMPMVFINHKCYSGPFLNKSRLAELPKSTGPGMVTLVIREVLASLINSAYKPPRVLKELQVENEMTAGMNGYLQIMKAKYKGKSYRALVEVPKTAKKVFEFLRGTLVKLECCPNLVSLTPCGDSCPENCAALSKNKCNVNYSKKKKIGRPPLKKKLMLNSVEPKKSHKKHLTLMGTMDTVKEDRMEQEPGENVQDPVAEIAASVEGGITAPAVKTPLVTRARALVVSAKRTKIQHAAPRLILPHRERGTRMKTFAARLRSNRIRKPVDKDAWEKPIAKPQVKPKKKVAAETANGTNKHSDSPPASSSPIPAKSSPTTTEEKVKNSKTEEKVKSTEKVSNPLYWTVEEVVQYFNGTDCAPLARIFSEQEIDGQAMLLLTLPTVQECMDLKLGPAIKLCHHIERLKIVFYEHYAK